MRYNSFLLRLWQTKHKGNSSDVNVHGRIEHVQSGTAARVADLDEVTAFIRQCLDTAGFDEEEDQVNGLR